MINLKIVEVLMTSSVCQLKTFGAAVLNYAGLCSLMEMVQTIDWSVSVNLA